MKSIFLLLTLVLTSLWAVAQGEEKPLEEIVIMPRMGKSICDLQIESWRIDNKLATDLGEILLMFPGIQLKSYGGVGGLKTASFRSLGAGHTSIVFDNVALSSTQSGQTDLGQLPTEFIHRVDLISMAATEVNLPIQSKLAGTLINVSSKHSSQNVIAKSNSIGIQYGSFQQIDGHLFLRKNWKKWTISTSGKIRKFDGAFPYSYQNGYTIQTAIRKNNDVLDGYATVGAQFRPNANNRFFVSLNGSGFDKGLPGAVVFYNESADQRLKGNQLAASFQHQFESAKNSVSSSGNVQLSHLVYTDSSYLNAQGYLVQNFQTIQIDGQSQWKHTLNEFSHVLIGHAIRAEQMESELIEAKPQRVTSESILGFDWRKNVQIGLQLGIQHIEDQRVENIRKNWNFLPSTSLKFSVFKKLDVALLYRYTVRQPTFSELYYQQIGNSDLEPEKAHVASLQFRYQGNVKGWVFTEIIQPFYSRVDDKIIAIPTKNLFIWSILNVGKTQAHGIEWTQQVRKRLGLGEIISSLSYTFQYAVDITDKNSETYRHILSYSPLHSGTLECSYALYNWSVFVLASYQGSRYALNENIPNNQLDPFLLLDLGGAYSWKFKSSNKLTLRGTLNNVTNRTYSYIRYFVLPGIHFNLRLNYVF